MKNILHTFAQLQYGLFFDIVIQTPNGLLCICRSNDFASENVLIIDEPLNKQDLSQAEDLFLAYDRVPSFYFLDSALFEPFKQELIQADYSQDSHEVFLSFATTSALEAPQSDIRLVRTEEELEMFLATFEASHNPDDPLNHEGGLGEYKETTKQAWLRSREAELETGVQPVLEYFLAYDETQPVAVATLTSHQGNGYIANIGSIPQVRGKGFGKQITLHALWRSQQNKNSFHFLATEKDSNAHSFYLAMGFTPEAEAVILTKSQHP